MIWACPDDPPPRPDDPAPPGPRTDAPVGRLCWYNTPMTDHPPRILVIEDEAAIRRFLRASLHASGYSVEEAADATTGMRMAAANPPDLILLDLGLPDADGLQVITQLREWCQAPIIVLSAREQERDKVAALDAGADDYLTKPFGVPELTARIRSALRRRSTTPDAATLVGDGLRIDLTARRVWRDDHEIHLTPLEYRLLVVLAQHPDRVVTHRQLLREVWGQTPSKKHSMCGYIWASCGANSKSTRRSHAI